MNISDRLGRIPYEVKKVRSEARYTDEEEEEER